jgi:hypothetical protein
MENNGGEWLGLRVLCDQKLAPSETLPPRASAEPQRYPARRKQRDIAECHQ